MFNTIDTSLSGMVAQRIRMNTISVNIANADAFDRAGEPAKRRSVIFETGSNGRDSSGQGVHVAAINEQDVSRLEYDPSHPYANADGYVKMPGINPVVEMVNLMESQRAYEANLAAMDVSKAMLNSSLRLLA